MPQPPPSSVSSSAHGTQQEDNASPGSSSTSPPSSIGGAATAAALGASSGSSSSLSGFILAVALFFGFLSFVWWLAWQLSLSKVPILREIFSDKEPKQHKNSSKQRTSRTAGNVGSFGADIAMGAGPGGDKKSAAKRARIFINPFTLGAGQEPSFRIALRPPGRKLCEIENELL